MLFAVTGLLGCPVDAIDGRVGVVKDILFDDESWKIRWMAVDAGVWSPSRNLLIHPSAIDPIDVSPRRDRMPMMTGPETPVVSVRLTKQKIEAGPETGEDEPITNEMEVRLYQYYGWDPSWGATFFHAEAASARASPALKVESEPSDGQDPRLESVIAIKGCHVHATDGDLGHVENLLADDVNWDIRYLVVATRDWLPGKHVKLAPFAVEGIDREGRRVNVNVTRDEVKSSPEWDPIAMADELAEQRYHQHFGWPGYGWRP